jgi:drug/metabolite transporter (DMT)-like permease
VVLKYLGEQLPVQQVAWMRFIVGFFVLYLFSSVTERSTLSIKLIDGLVFLRATLGLIAFVCFVYSIRQMSLSVWTAVQFTNPLMLALFAALILGERIPLLRCVAIVAGFIGVIVIADPRGTVKLIPLLVLLIGCASAALSDIVVKKIALKYNSNAIVLSFFAIASLLLTPFALWAWSSPSFMQWLLLFTVALLGLASQLCLTRAFALAPASIVAPFSYTSIVWSTLFGVMFFNELPTARETIGILFILVDGFLTYLSIFGRGMKRAD